MVIYSELKPIIINIYKLLHALYYLYLKFENKHNLNIKLIEL